MPPRDLDVPSLDVGLDGPFSVLSLIPTPATAYTHPTHAGTHKGTHSPCTRVFWARFHPPVTGVCEVQTDTPHAQRHPPGCDCAASEALTRPLNHRTAGRAHSSSSDKPSTARFPIIPILMPYLLHIFLLFLLYHLPADSKTNCLNEVLVPPSLWQWPCPQPTLWCWGSG